MVTIRLDRLNDGNRDDAHDRKNLGLELEWVDRDRHQKLFSRRPFRFPG
jgi:hypothetical protein